MILLISEGMHWHQYDTREKKSEDDTFCTEETKALFAKQKCFTGRACFTVSQSPKGVSKPASLKRAIKSCTDGPIYGHVRDCHKE